MKAEDRDIVRHSSVFRFLSDEHFDAIEALLQDERYDFGDVIVKQGDPADAFYVLTTGRARALKIRADGEEIPLGVLKPGDSFGEAALADGCNRLQALYKVILPLAAPGILTAALLVFIHAWNEFFFALIIMTDPNVQTLPVGIALFPGEYTMPWGEIAAASTIATLPLILLTLIFQRGIVRGLSAGAVKG